MPTSRRLEAPRSGARRRATSEESRDAPGWPPTQEKSEERALGSYEILRVAHRVPTAPNLCLEHFKQIKPCLLRKRVLGHKLKASWGIILAKMKLPGVVKGVNGRGVRLLNHRHWSPASRSRCTASIGREQCRRSCPTSEHSWERPSEQVSRGRCSVCPEQRRQREARTAGRWSSRRRSPPATGLPGSWGVLTDYRR
jgi:hypothetical protein